MHEVHPFIDKDEYSLLTLQAFMSGNVMQTVDWLWDFWRKEKVYPKNEEGLPMKYYREPLPSLYEKRKNKENNKVTMEEIGNGEWTKLQDLVDDTIMLTLNVKDDGDWYPREGVPLSIGNEGVTKDEGCAPLCKEVSESKTLNCYQRVDVKTWPKRYEDLLKIAVNGLDFDEKSYRWDFDFDQIETWIGFVGLVKAYGPRI